jgi:uncharacterized protein YdaU (DUF1376 family)
MHRYSFHIGDYVAHTRHLTLMENLAYRLMLDVYYLHERPLPAAVEDVARAVGMREQVTEVEAVLREFFVLDEQRGGWTNARADSEIADYKAKGEAASRAGKASAAARSTSVERTQSNRVTHVKRRFNTRSTTVEQPLNDRSTPVERPCNQPRTKNQVPPNPPDGALNAHGASAARPDPAPDPNPAPAADSGPTSTIRDASPIADLTNALLRTRYRAGIGNAIVRRGQIHERATELVATGLTLEYLRRLLELADARSNGDPGALLAHWLDGGDWRGVLEEQNMKARQRGDIARGKAAQPDGDTLDGIYGDTLKPATSAIDSVLRNVAGGA